MDLRPRLALERGDRVLAVARDPGGAHVLVATERALFHRADGIDWRRQGWERISAVNWDGAGHHLIVTSLTSAGPETQRSVLAVGDRGYLAELFSERITHTRLGRWSLMLPGGEPVTVEARRRPVTGELLWLVHQDGICRDISDRTVHGAVTSAIAWLGADLGITVQEPADGAAVDG